MSKQHDKDKHDKSDAATGRRAKARAAWPIRKYALGHEPGEDLSASMTPVQCLEMMWPLAREAWLLAHKHLPDYSRQDTPMRVIRAPKQDAGQDVDQDVDRMGA